MATKKNRKQNRRLSPPKTTSSAFSIVLSFFVGYALAHVFDINYIGKYYGAIINNRHSSSPKTHSAKTKPNLPKPKFEYYSLLAKEGFSNKGGSDNKKKLSNITVSEASPLEPIIQVEHNYFLQLASYYKRNDAERMKAELILQGHSTSIEVHKSKDRIIYRLLIGPFKLKTEAEKTQVDLAKKFHVMGMIRRTQLS